MQQAEMEKRCQEAVDQIGDKTLSASVMMIAGLEYDLREWIQEGQGNTPQVANAIGQCYTALKMLEMYIGADPADIESGIVQVLSYT